MFGVNNKHMFLHISPSPTFIFSICPPSTPSIPATFKTKVNGHLSNWSKNTCELVFSREGKFELNFPNVNTNNTLAEKLQACCSLLVEL